MANGWPLLRMQSKLMPYPSISTTGRSGQRRLFRDRSVADSGHGRPVGRVVGLWRYPVKSMGAEALPGVEVSWHGLVGDRRWAFIRNNVPQSGFSWFTLRERPDMSHYRPSFVVRRTRLSRPFSEPRSNPVRGFVRCRRPRARGGTLPRRHARHQARPRHLRHLSSVDHHDPDPCSPGRDGRPRAGRAALSTEHPCAG